MELLLWKGFKIEEALKLKVSEFSKWNNKN